MRQFSGALRYVNEMSMPDLAKAEELFHQALSLPQGTDTAAWLASECGGDSLLFTEVSSLLTARALMAAASTPRESPLPSIAFGPYRTVRLLGRGGMSAVYLAERADGQFQLSVAVKVMAGYLADPEFTRRFEAERRFQAALDHPNITHILDGGLSSNGDPYLVTEFVDGKPLDRYCDEGKLAIEVRLRIFLQVCDAVDHAHRNLILHRDLKPANILVTAEGGVKLLDFGTAAFANRAQATITRHRMLTPRYASPEQLRGERVNIATDIFSLGIILYELLTGAWPFGDPASVLSELDRSTGRVSAAQPSNLVTAESAAGRSLSKTQLTRILDGDLSAIALKALEAEPARRYQTVRALAGDIENYLSARPVSAKPQTFGYRAAKFLRRRWPSVTAASFFAFGIGAAAIVSWHQAQVARSETQRAMRMNEFLNTMLASPSEVRVDPRTYTMEQMLDQASARLAKGEWSSDRRVEASLQRSLGVSYVALFRVDRARPLLEKALATFQSLGDPKEIAWTRLRLADAIVYSDPKAAAGQYEQILAESRNLRKDSPALLEFAAKDHLSNTLYLYLQTRLPEARKLSEEAVALGKSDPSIPKTDLAQAFGHLAMFMADGKKAEALLNQALSIFRQEDPNSIWQADPLFRLYLIKLPVDPAAAADLGYRRYQVILANCGPDNPNTAGAKILWARARALAGPAQEAEAAVRDVQESLPLMRKAFPHGLDLWVSLVGSAVVMNQSHRFPEAAALAREAAVVLDDNHLPATDPRRSQTAKLLARAIRGAGGLRTLSQTPVPSPARQAGESRIGR